MKKPIWEKERTWKGAVLNAWWADLELVAVDEYGEPLKIDFKTPTVQASMHAGWSYATSRIARTPDGNSLGAFRRGGTWTKPQLYRVPSSRPPRFLDVVTVEWLLEHGWGESTVYRREETALPPGEYPGAPSNLTWLLTRGDVLPLPLPVYVFRHPSGAVLSSTPGVVWREAELEAGRPPITLTFREYGGRRR